MLTGRQELVDSETHIVADEAYDDEAKVDISDEELKKVLKPFAAVDVMLTSDEES